MLCKIQVKELPDGNFEHTCENPTCDFVGVLDHASPGLVSRCRGIPQARRFFNFTVAAIAHLFNGVPSCTQEQIDVRIALCRECSFYKAVSENFGYCTHKDCGCGVTDKKAFISKIAWADQHCPIKKW